MNRGGYALRSIIVLLSFLSALAQAHIDSCLYNGSAFLVQADQHSYSYAATPNFDDAAFACSAEVAGLYDGDELIVFDDATKSFSWNESNADYLSAQLRAAGKLVGLYDGKALQVYDGSRSKFQSTPANDSFRSSRLSVGSGALGLYDGDKFIVYDSGKGAFFSQTARPREFTAQVAAQGSIVIAYDLGDLLLYDGNQEGIQKYAANTGFVLPVVLAAEDGALLYDGKNVQGYCAKDAKLIHEEAGTDLWAEGKYEKRQDLFVVTVLSHQYRFNPIKCTIEKRAISNTLP